jgi:hypothetical protein
MAIEKMADMAKYLQFEIDRKKEIIKLLEMSFRSDRPREYRFGKYFWMLLGSKNERGSEKETGEEESFSFSNDFQCQLRSGG